MGLKWVILRRTMTHLDSIWDYNYHHMFEYFYKYQHHKEYYMYHEPVWLSYLKRYTNQLLI